HRADAMRHRVDDQLAEVRGRIVFAKARVSDDRPRNAIGGRLHIDLRRGVFLLEREPHGRRLAQRPHCGADDKRRGGKLRDDHAISPNPWRKTSGRFLAVSTAELRLSGQESGFVAVPSWELRDRAYLGYWHSTAGAAHEIRCRAVGAAQRGRSAA